MGPAGNRGSTAPVQRAGGADGALSASVAVHPCRWAPRRSGSAQAAGSLDPAAWRAGHSRWPSNIDALLSLLPPATALWRWHHRRPAQRPVSAAWSAWRPSPIGWLRRLARLTNLVVGAAVGSRRTAARDWPAAQPDRLLLWFRRACSALCSRTVSRCSPPPGWPGYWYGTPHAPSGLPRRVAARDKSRGPQRRWPSLPSTARPPRSSDAAELAQQRIGEAAPGEPRQQE